MRKMLCAMAAGLAAIAAAARGQPTGYYPGPNASYAYRYAPPRAYGPSGDYTPETYYSGYDTYYGQEGRWVAPPGAAAAEAAIEHAPRDAYGPDPNGLVAPDGHRIKCKLVGDWSSYAGRHVTRRECW